MNSSSKIPQTFLEDMNILRDTNQFQINEKRLMQTEPNLISEDYPNNYETRNNFPSNNYRNNIKYSGYPPNYKSNRNNNPSDYDEEEYNFKMNKFNNSRQFAWKEIMRNNPNNYQNYNNPLVQNILGSEINEKDIQNLPEEYIVNLIHTLQGVANNAIQKENDLIEENQKLNYHLRNINQSNSNFNSNSNDEPLKMLQRENKQQRKIIEEYQRKINEISTEKESFSHLVDDDESVGEYRPKKEKKFKERFYCCYCANKKFKSEYYLNEHMKRRHMNYLQNYLKEKNRINTERQSQIKIDKYEKKLEEMKKTFESFITETKMRNDYKRLNDKLNGIETIISMSRSGKLGYPMGSNGGMMSTQNLKSQQFPINNQMSSQFQQPPMNKTNETVIISSNVEKKINIVPNYNDDLQEISLVNEIKKELDENNKITDKNIKAIKEGMKKIQKMLNNKNAKEISSKKQDDFFDELKKQFEENPGNDTKNEKEFYRKRREKRNKTTIGEFSTTNNLKNITKNQSDPTLSINENEEKNNNKNNIENEKKTEENNNKKDNDLSNKNNKNIHDNNELIHFSHEESKTESDKKNDSNVLQSKNNMVGLPEEKKLWDFYTKFIERDFRDKEIDYLKEILPKDFETKKDIKSIIDDKIQEKEKAMRKKISQSQTSNNSLYFLLDLVSALYNEMGEKGQKYGYYSSSMNKKMGTKDMIDYSDNFYFDNKKVSISRNPFNKNESCFENISYNVKSRLGDDTIEEGNKDSDFSFKVN